MHFLQYLLTQENFSDCIGCRETLEGLSRQAVEVRQDHEQTYASLPVVKQINQLRRQLHPGSLDHSNDLTGNIAALRTQEKLQP